MGAMSVTFARKDRGESGIGFTARHRRIDRRNRPRQQAAHRIQSDAGGTHLGGVAGALVADSAGRVVRRSMILEISAAFLGPSGPEEASAARRLAE